VTIRGSRTTTSHFELLPGIGVPVIRRLRIVMQLFDAAKSPAWQIESTR